MTHWLDLTREWSAAPAESLRQAAEWASKAIACDGPNDGLGYVILGSVRLLERRHNEALALCRKGIAYRANGPYALGQLAVIRNYCGDPRGAVKSAREALTVRLIYPPPLVNVLATAYRDSGELGLSIAAAPEAARLDPARADALVTLCSDHVLAGDDVEAHRVAEQTWRSRPRFGCRPA